MYWDDIDHHRGADRRTRLWLANPDVRQSVNAAVSGSAGEWPLDWFVREFPQLVPLGKCAVIGCGAGALERDLVSKGTAEQVVAVDAAPSVVAFAEQEAVRADLNDSVTYVVQDASEFLQQHKGTFDAIFFHGSLHHLSPVESIVRLARRALRSDGIIYIDEYIGPSMHQWTWWRLIPANIAYYLLTSRALRRPRLVRAPRNHDDPTEMIDSASIRPAMYQLFHVLADRGYGGNILGLVYANLNHAVDEETLRKAVVRLLGFERRLVRITGHHYAVMVGQKRPEN